MFGIVGKDLVRYLPGQVVLAIIAFVSVPILTRLLAPAHFGQFALVMSSVAVAVNIFGSLPMAIIRFGPAAKGGELEILLRSSVWVQVILVFSGAIGFVLVSRLIWPDSFAFQRFVDVGTSIVALQAIFVLLVETLRANRRVGEYNAFTIWSKGIGLITGLVLALYFHSHVFGVLWGVVVGFGSALPFLWRRVFIGMRAIGPLSFPLVREMVWFGAPLVVGNVGGWVLRYFDRYLIQAYFGAYDVGIYSAAYSISEHSIGLLATLFMLSSTPLITNVWEKGGQQASKQLFTAVTRLYLVVCVPAVVGLSVLAEPLLTVLTGRNFSGGYSIVPWVVAGAFFLGLQHRFNQTLRLLKRTREIMLWVISSSGLNVVLNYWLLPIYGYQIAAVNTLICCVFLCGGQAWSSRRSFPWRFPWRTGLRSGVAAAVMFIGVYVLKHTLSLSAASLLCVGIPTGIVIYLLGVWLLGEVSLSEVKAVRLSDKVNIARGAADF
jgi:O-antigen/teichoic acid export membrane protein